MQMRATRRRLLEMIGAFGGAITLGRFFPGFKRSEAFAGDSLGERYDNFLILPDEAKLPTDVRPTGIWPSLEGGGGSAAKYFDDAQGLRSIANVPIYRLASPLPGTREGRSYLIRNKQGQVAAASVGYESYDKELKAWATTVDITSSEVYLWPVPVWPTWVDDVLVDPLRVDGLPGPAVMSRTYTGHLIQWMEAGTLFQLRVETPGTDPSADAKAAVGLLRAVGP